MCRCESNQASSAPPSHSLTLHLRLPEHTENNLHCPSNALPVGGETLRETPPAKRKARGPIRLFDISLFWLATQQTGSIATCETET
jgi:hypothetical protein